MAEPMPAAGGAPRRWWDLTPKERNIVAFTLLFLITLPMLTKIFTSDFGTHIAIGREIVQTRTIADKEFLNYPSLGQYNPNGEWGFQAILYLVFSVGGVYGVSFLVWAIVFATFLLLHRAAVLRGAHPLLAVLAIFAFSGFLRIRHPAAAGDLYVLFHRADDLPVQRIFLRDEEEAHLPVSARRAGLGELSPDVPDGVPSVRSVRRGSIGPRDLAERVPVGHLEDVDFSPRPCGPGRVDPVRPESPRVQRDPYPASPDCQGNRKGQGGSSILMSISELTPVKGTGFFVYYKAAAAFAVVSLLLGLAGRKIYLLDLFLFAIAFKGAWDSARAVSMMGLFLSPGVSLHLTGFLSVAAGWFSAKVTRTPKAPEEKRRQKGKKGPPPAAVSVRADPRPRFTAGYAALVVVVVLAFVAFGGTTLAFSFSQLEYGVGITEHKFSFKAAEFLRKNPIQGKMFNFFDIGGFLDWQLYPQALTFIDGRTYNQEVFMEHQVVTGAIAGVGEGSGEIRHQLHRPEIDGLLRDDPADRAGPRQRLPTGRWSSRTACSWSLSATRRNCGDTSRHMRSRRGSCRGTSSRRRIITPFSGSPRSIAYQTMANMYLMLGDREEAIQSLRRGLEEVNDPYLRARLMQLQGGVGTR